MLEEKVSNLTQSFDHKWIIAWEEKECHKDYINDILIISEKNLVLTCSNDNTIKVWRLSFCQLIHNIDKAHEDAVKSLIYHPLTKKVFSGGLDKILREWSLSSETTNPDNIFSQVSITIGSGIPEEIPQTPEPEAPQNLITELDPPNENLLLENNSNHNFVLKKGKEITCSRINEMLLAEQNFEFIYILSLANKTIARFDPINEKMDDQFVCESQDIMTFSINKKATLMITSLIGTVPCFHLWMLNGKNFLSKEILMGSTYSGNLKFNLSGKSGIVSITYCLCLCSYKYHLFNVIIH